MLVAGFLELYTVHPVMHHCTAILEYLLCISADIIHMFIHMALLYMTSVSGRLEQRCVSGAVQWGLPVRLA